MHREQNQDAVDQSPPTNEVILASAKERKQEREIERLRQTITVLVGAITDGMFFVALSI